MSVDRQGTSARYVKSHSGPKILDGVLRTLVYVLPDVFCVTFDSFSFKNIPNPFQNELPFPFSEGAVLKLFVVVVSPCWKTSVACGLGSWFLDFLLLLLWTNISCSVGSFFRLPLTVTLSISYGLRLRLLNRGLARGTTTLTHHLLTTPCFLPMDDLMCVRTIPLNQPVTLTLRPELFRLFRFPGTFTLVLHASPLELPSISPLLPTFHVTVSFINPKCRLFLNTTFSAHWQTSSLRCNVFTNSHEKSENHTTTSRTSSPRPPPTSTHCYIEKKFEPNNKHKKKHSHDDKRPNLKVRE
mmetsp:Transcript_3587/g.5103  ORF Transcript_3587/g.5103 Transcript_3587/m.5103 type:complete len:298 (+) Transcript_3587:1146-2039(+)